jgi:peroxiredoxin
MDHLPTGSTAPDFELQTLEGQSLRLSEALESGPVMVVFYKQSCPTCQLTFPFIQRLFATAGAGSEVRIWAISQDAVEETRAFVGEYGLEFPVLLDAHPYPVSSDYELRFVPTFYLVDGDQTIQVADFGFSKPTLSSIARRLKLEDDGALFGEDYQSLPDYRPG